MLNKTSNPQVHGIVFALPVLTPEEEQLVQNITSRPSDYTEEDYVEAIMFLSNKLTQAEVFIQTLHTSYTHLQKLLSKWAQGIHKQKTTGGSK